ncbi:helix-turn-helix domain-containing protein [Streptomyces sp. TRM 70361]|uniref:PucR family transcriptional regulator n=1 Tax=Streptomyces sp. TRM 70361 TaxID=3116553 RepID=UPI002E7BAA12|nr:helix-turn-helix domain-containing protein [Streptomyces sp. TRM 70361]MEE1938925.1 helix-turn-helix domain-containing protein [Streptomyces sp. TRM 70361]
MCELLNRIWSRPRGEWAHVLRKELPSLAERVAEELRYDPRLAGVFADTKRECVREAVEQALLAVLGYRTEAECAPDTGVTGNEAEDPRGAAGRETGEARRGPGAGRNARREPLAAPVPIDRARRHLFAALTSDAREPESSLTELARSARWPLPEAVRVVVLAAPAEALQVAAMLGDALISIADGEPCLIVPDHGVTTRTALENALRGRRAVVGHPVPPGETLSSLRWARRLLALTPPRAAGAEIPVTFVDDHLSMLLLLQDESLTRALSARWLQPLDDLTPRQSERLEMTLLAWLEGGGAPEAAKTLQVHPQTVRYRLRQIEKLFGSALRDPRTRFELEMTLRSRRLMAQVRRRYARAGRTGRAMTGIRPLAGARQARVNGL